MPLAQEAEAEGHLERRPEEAGGEGLLEFPGEAGEVVVLPPVAVEAGEGDRLLVVEAEVEEEEVQHLQEGEGAEEGEEVQLPQEEGEEAVVAQNRQEVVEVEVGHLTN